MAVNIVTGMTGKAHITSDDDRAKNVLSFGTGKYVMDYGKKFETSILSNNQIRVRDGMCINQGTQMGIELNNYEDVTIQNGVSGSNRNDLIVMRYEKNEDTGIEKASLVVIKGTSGSKATDPSYNSGNILDGGDMIDDMPLFRVKIESLTITKVEQLFVVFDYSHRKALAGLSNVDNTSDEDKTVNIAKKLSNTSAIGSATKPVYFNANGVPVEGKYTLGAACAKGVSTSVLNGDTNLVTGDAVSKAIYTATNYEEGEWTPKLYIIQFDTQYEPIRAAAAYKRVGNIVHIRAYLNYDSPLPSSSVLYLKGLPVAINPGNYAGSMLNDILIGKAIVNGITSKSLSSGSLSIDIDLQSETKASEVIIDTIYWI